MLLSGQKGMNDMSSHRVRHPDLKAIMIQDLEELHIQGKLPARAVLAGRYGVSRATIDRVVSELVGEGYLYTKDKSGTYVASHRPAALPSRGQPETRQIAVIVPYIEHDVYVDIIRGIEAAVDEQGYSIILRSSDNDTAKQNDFIEKMYEEGAAGLIMVPSIYGLGAGQGVDLLRRQRIPVVCCNRCPDDLTASRVLINNVYGSYLAVNHLLAQGYHRIAYVAQVVYTTSVERLQGYAAALGQHGLPYEERYTYLGASQEDFEAIREAVRHMLAMDDAPDAFCCFNEVTTAVVYRAIEDAGRAIGDIGLVTYDETKLNERMPKLL